MKQYILTLLIIFLLSFVSKASNKNNCYYHVTFETLDTKNEKEWKKDTVVFEFDLTDSTLFIYDLNKRQFDILSISLNDYRVLGKNTMADIYKLSDGYYLWLSKSKDTQIFDITQVILFDDKELYYLYK